jgi:cell division protein FtsB
MGYHNIQYSWDIRQLNKQLRVEHHREMVLNQKLADVKKEPYIEQQARTVLGLVKQGEIAYQIVNE